MKVIGGSYLSALDLAPFDVFHIYKLVFHIFMFNYERVHFCGQT